MPIHDWASVDAGIFHDFRHSWIYEIQRTLNHGLLPAAYYAMIEPPPAGCLETARPLMAPPTAGLEEPRAAFCLRAEGEIYHRKRSAIVVRHLHHDQMIAVIEIISPDCSHTSFETFLENACHLLEQGVHLLILSPVASLKRTAHGVHAALWERICDRETPTVPGKPLTLAAYEAGAVITAYLEMVAVGDRLPEMPLILEPGGAVHLPVEETYARAWDAVPRRWQRVLEPSATL